MKTICGTSAQACSPLLDGLESSGLMERAPSASDRRSHALYLTGEGNRLLDSADELVQEHERRLMKKIGTSGHKKLIKILKVFGGGN